MARKKEITIIHPRTAIDSLGEYLEDSYYMRGVLENGYRLAIDDTLDPAKVLKALSTQFKEALDRMKKWSEAD